MPEQMMTGKQQVVALRPTIDQLRSIGENWANLLYKLEKFAEAYDFLLNRYAKFHVGDRVQLSTTPVINETQSPGWLGSKHFLVAGALGTVREADVRKHAFYYQIVFDAESWQDSKRIIHPIDPDRRASYCFREDELTDAFHRPAPSQA